MIVIVTIKDVAKKAGVSTSTVSRVISGNGPVNDATRQKVMEAVRALNYRPNFLAKGLKEGRTKTIGLIIPNIRNPIFPAVVRGVEDTARKQGYTVVLCNTDEDVLIEREYVEKLRKRWVDGFILATVSEHIDHVLELKKKGFPVVLLIRNIDKHVDAVIIDNFKAAYKAVSYLVKTGHKKIAIIKGNQQLALYRERFRGYKQALKDAGLPLKEQLITGEDAECVQWSRDGYNAINRLLDQSIDFDAVFATTDLRAIGAIRAIKDHGLRVPEDISVIGFDNLEFSSLLDPPLSTMAQPFYDMGARAVNKLIQLIKNGQNAEPVIDVMEAELIIRKSTR